MDKRLKELEEIGKELLINGIKSDVEASFIMWSDYLMEFGTTPIEKYFILGLNNYFEIKSFSGKESYGETFINGILPDCEKKLNQAIKEIKEIKKSNFIIITQYKVGKYTADFFILYPFYNSQFERMEEFKVIVECDGHDFHEKTKEQAQRDKERDRYFQKEGYFVFRYTGSEIYKDPFKASAEVLDFILKNHNDTYFKSRDIKRDLNKSL